MICISGVNAHDIDNQDNLNSIGDSSSSIPMDSNADGLGLISENDVSSSEFKEDNSVLDSSLLGDSVGESDFYDSRNVLLNKECHNDSFEDIQNDLNINDLSHIVKDQNHKLSDDSARIHYLTSKNFDSYFDEDGYLISSKVNPYDVFDLSGTFYEKDFIFTLPVIITSSNNDALLEESTIQFNGVNASFSNHAKVSNLKINNSRSGINGVLLTYSKYIDVFDNDIYTTGASGNPVRLLFSNYSHVFNNKLETYYFGLMNASWLHAAIILGDSHYNNLSSNDVAVKDSNGIYLSSYGVPPSNHNTIFNNTIHSTTISESTGLPNPSSWSYGIQCMGDYNLVLNNTVYNSYRGSSADGHYNRFIGNTYFNLTGGYMEGNNGTEGSDYGIFGSYNAIIANNTFYDSHFAGYAINAGLDNTVYGNDINVEKGGGIYIDADSNDTRVFNNIIDIGTGDAIYSPAQMNNLLIRNNTIFENDGNAIKLYKRTKATHPDKVEIIDNLIYSPNDSPIVYDGLEDYVILKDNIIRPSIIISNSNFFSYFDEGGVLKNLNKSIDFIVFKGSINVKSEDNSILVNKSDVNSISVNIPVNILGKEATLNNLQLNIKSDNVTVENMVFNSSNLNIPVIYDNCFDKLRLIGNTIYSDFDNANAISSVNRQGTSSLYSNAVIFLSNVSYAELSSNNIFSANGILINDSHASIMANKINISSNSLAILSLNDSLVNMSYNVISVNGVFAVNLTDTGFGDLKNEISNNHLMRNSSQALVYYDDGCDSNSIIHDNFGLKTNILVEGNVAYVNRNPILVLHLVDLNDQPLANSKVLIKISGPNGFAREYNLTTDDNGAVIINQNNAGDDLVEGNYTFDAFYSAISPYKDSNLSNQKLEIKKMATNVIVSDESINYCSNIVLEANLMGEDDSNLGAKLIDLKVKSPDGKIIREISNYTINGLVQFNLGALDTGSYTAEFSFAGDNECLKSNAESKLKVNAMPTTINSSNMVMYYQNGSQLVAYLYDNMGQAISNKAVSISIAGKSYTRTTDSKGKLSLTISLIPKKYSVVLKFAGDNNYKASSKTVNVNVVTRTSKIVASNFLKYYKDSKKLTFYLKDSNNKAIASKSVSIVVNKKTYKRTTDKNGKVSILLDLKKNSYKTTIKFSAKYYKSASKTITVKVVYPVIKASSTSVKRGKKLNIAFKTYNNKILKKEKVYFKFKGKTYTLYTNAKGIASLTCSMSKGSYSLVAGLKNTNTYGKYTRTIKFRVK